MLSGGDLLASSFSGTASQSRAGREIRIAVGCPAVPACGELGLGGGSGRQASKGNRAWRPTVYIGGYGSAKDPEIVDQLAQGLLHFGVTNFVMINEVDPRVARLPGTLHVRRHAATCSGRSTRPTFSDSIRRQHAGTGHPQIAGLTGLGGTFRQSSSTTKSLIGDRWKTSEGLRDARHRTQRTHERKNSPTGA